MKLRSLRHRQAAATCHNVAGHHQVVAGNANVLTPGLAIARLDTKNVACSPEVCCALNVCCTCDPLSCTGAPEGGAQHQHGGKTHGTGMLHLPHPLAPGFPADESQSGIGSMTASCCIVIAMQRGGLYMRQAHSDSALCGVWNGYYKTTHDKIRGRLAHVIEYEEAARRIHA